MSHILVVEDEAHLANGLRFNLEAEGHTVQITDNGEDALVWLIDDKQKFDAIVLDVMLPGVDGFAVAKRLREAQNFVPVLMLTARSRPEDVLRGFESGADDYLPKPFNLAILIARIGSLLRRKQWLSNDTVSEPVAANGNEPSFDFADKHVDFQKLQLRSGKRVYQLTLMEGDLLRYLIQNSGRPVTRKEILEKVWNLHEDTDTRAIDNFIVRLRKYIEDEPAKPKHLVTIRGLGYEFVAQPAAETN
jgi:DNA-binding response OmpR family regulator